MDHYLGGLGFQPEEVIGLHPEHFVAIEHPSFPLVSTFRDVSGVTINAAVDGTSGFRMQTCGLSGMGSYLVAATQIIPGVVRLELLAEDAEGAQNAVCGAQAAHKLVPQTLIVHVDDPHLYGGYEAGPRYSRTIFEDYRLGGVCLEVSTDPLQALREPELLSPEIPDHSQAELTCQHAVASTFVMDVRGVRRKTNSVTGREWVLLYGDCGIGQEVGFACSPMQAANIVIGDRISGAVYLSGTTGLWEVGFASVKSSHMRRGAKTFELYAPLVGLGAQSMLR
ncbi:MAG: hypothetical protein Q3976_05920 [Corynebacterium sp.]|nr:hypothetical protein [Corynebacterium sp.]